MAVLATVSGTAIRPGVSRNNRLYTAAVIGKAVERAQQRIAEGGMPLTTLTHHGADDDSTRIVGRLTGITYNESDGSASYTAEITDTTHGRDILSLVDGPNPVLKGVSIRGAWLGKVRREQGPDGQTVETADDLELDGLDYTRKPGVPGAQIDHVQLAGAAPRESDGTSRVPITESAPEATVTITEATDDTGDGPYADPGYQADKKKRYPLDTKSRAKAAWSYVNQADNARLYSSNQLKRIKQRIVKALKGYGVTVSTQERWLVDQAQEVTETLAECWDMPEQAGQMYLSLTNGPTTVTVSSYLLDPHDLDLVGRAAMAGAVQALMSLDPDMDADIDLPGADDEDTDRDTGAAESAPTDRPAAGDPLPDGVTAESLRAVGAVTGQSITPELAEAALAAAGVTPDTPIPAPDSAAEPTREEEPAMAESTPAAEATPAATDNSALDTLTAQVSQLTTLMSGFVTAFTAQAAPAPVEAAPAAAEPVAETAAPAPAAPQVTETEDQRIARLVATALQEHVEQAGPPSRKGLVESTTPQQGAVTESGIPASWPQKPLHQYTAEEFRQYVSASTADYIVPTRTPAQA